MGASQMLSMVDHSCWMVFPLSILITVISVNICFIFINFYLLLNRSSSFGFASYS